MREGVPLFASEDDATQIGTITSGGWGHRVGFNIAYAFVDPAYAQEQKKFEVDVLGSMVDAQVVAPGIYDSDLVRVRS